MEIRSCSSAIAIDLKNHLENILNDVVLVKETLHRLLEAFSSCDLAFFQTLLNLGLNPNLPLSGNFTPLTYLMSSATSGNWTEVAKLLIIRGASPNVVDRSGVPIVFSIVSAGETDLLALCIDRGANVEAAGPEGLTLLFAAVHYRQLECLRLLLKNGVNVNAKDSDGSTAAVWAASRSNGIGMQRSLSCLKILIENGADINICNKRGVTPLMAASLIREDAAVVLLVKEGADLNRVDEKGQSALFKAIDGNAEATAIFLIDSGADVNSSNSFGVTCLMRTSSVLVVEKLLSAGADVNRVDGDGRTALHHQAEEDRPETLKILIAFRAALDTRTVTGETPVQMSIRRRNYRCSHVLLEAGCSLASFNCKGVSLLHDLLLPWDYFCTCDVFEYLNTPPLWRELIFYATAYRSQTHRLLERLSPTPASATAAGTTPLMLAAASGDFWSAKYLVSKGADPLRVDKWGRSALSYAARSGNIKTVNYLLHIGCSSTQVDKNGNLPIYYASHFEHEEVILVLMVEFAFFFCSRHS